MAVIRSFIEAGLPRVCCGWQAERSWPAFSRGTYCHRSGSGRDSSTCHVPRSRAARVKPGYLILGALVAIGSIIGTGTLLPHFAPDTFEDEALAAQAIGARTQGGSNYSIAAGGSLYGSIPLALATVLYRPLIFEASNGLIAVNALEMTAAIVLTIMALTRESLGRTLRFVLGRPALCFALGLVLTLAVGVGLTTTNLGTLSRYRMPLIPFYATLLVVLAY